MSFTEVYTEETKKLIKNEFKRLNGASYLDHAGAALYSEVQIKNIYNDLENGIYGNPHSLNISSKLMHDIIDQVRLRILSFFNTNEEEYSIIFTSGTTGSLKLIGENFNYYDTNKENSGILLYLQDNHTSVLGMREFSKKFESILPEKFQELINKKDQIELSSENLTNSLFVYPAQSNFSGQKYPLNWIDRLEKIDKSTKWYCLLDAATYVSTNYLNLSKYKPDFVAISFYKIFGYPTGLGALIVKKSSEIVLKKRYFGGGTVEISLSQENYCVRRKKIHERFEDGTISFLSILSLKHSFDTFERLKLSMCLISEHIFNLTNYTFSILKDLKHSNDRPVAKIYSKFPLKLKTHGGILAFNLLKSNGAYVGYSEVLNVANLHKISLRTGCFCNPGGCQMYLGLSNEILKKHHQLGHICGDQYDLIDGNPTGAVRISFGYMSTKKDADTFFQMIQDCFIETNNESIIGINNNLKQNSINVIDKLDQNKSTMNISNLYIYPIKSCGAFEIKNKKWFVCDTGLLYDRQWMIVSSHGVCLTQKTEVNLCLIKPVIDLANDLLILNFPELDELKLPLNLNTKNNKNISICESKVCLDRIEAFDYGEVAAKWLELALNKPNLKLLKKNNEFSRVKIKKKKGQEMNDLNFSKLSLVNESQFLLVNKTSVNWLLDIINEESNAVQFLNLNNFLLRFRANFVVELDDPFKENYLDEWRVNGFSFKYDGLCTRCQMVCVDQTTGLKTVEPLKTLSKKMNEGIKFGVYFKFSNEEKCKPIDFNLPITIQDNQKRNAKI